jgi:branched-chain amino acid transport system permease protein
LDLTSTILQYLLSGLMVGSIYAVVALGFVIIHNMTGIINFAQGEFVMLGGMLIVTFTEMKIPIPAAFLLTVILVTLIGCLLERAAIYPARGASIISLIIITIGASIAIRGLALLFCGTEPKILAPFSPGDPISILGATMVRQGLWILGITLIMVLLLYLFFEHTLLGKAVRACAFNPMAAKLMGINVGRMSLFSFGLSAALSSVAGIIITPITFATYDMGVMLGLKGFVAAIIGGMSSAPVAVLGGLGLGVLESMGAGFISSGYKDALAFIVLVAILIFKATEIFKLKTWKAKFLP